MIAKIVKGKSFKGVVNYILDKAKQTELLATEGVRHKSHESIIRSFVTQTELNPRVAKAILLFFSQKSKNKKYLHIPFVNSKMFIIFARSLTMNNQIK